MTARTKLTIQRKKERFLAGLMETCSITRSAKAANITRMLAYDWRDADPEFRLAWEKALEKGSDVLEDEATRRAHQGVQRTIYYQGVKIGVEREYSDTLMCLLLKGRRGQKFRERVTQELSGPNGGPIETVPVDPIAASQAYQKTLKGE